MRRTTLIPMHRFTFNFVSVCLAVACGTSIAFGQNNAPSDRYLVTVAPGNDPAQVAAAHGLNPRHVYSRALNGFAAQVPPGRWAALANDARVAGVSIDHPVFAFA